MLKFIFIFLLSLNIFAEDKIKKIYLESLENVNVKNEIILKVRNHISLNVVNNFKNKYVFIDDSVINGLLLQLKKQQKLGCDYDKCYQMIEDNLNPDEKIVGSIRISHNQYILTLKKIEVKQNGGGITAQQEIAFYQEELEDSVEKIITNLLGNNFKFDFFDNYFKFKINLNLLDKLNLSENKSNQSVIQATDNDFSFEKVILPGYLHLDKNPDSSHGRFYKNLGFFSLGLVAVSGLNYLEKSGNNQTDMLSTYWLAYNYNLPLATIYYQNSINERNQYMDRNLDYVRGSASLFSIIYFFSLADYSYNYLYNQNKQQQLNSLNILKTDIGNINIKTERVVLDRSSSNQVDEKINIIYEINF
jgi:hypothetical protein